MSYNERATAPTGEEARRSIVQSDSFQDALDEVPAK